MIGIVIVAHGGLAKEYLAAVEHVVGKQSGIIAIAIEDNHDRDVKQAEICDAADLVDEGDGVVVVTDMFGGSPSNLSLRACSPDNRKILYGANLPMLIKLAKSRTKPVPDAVRSALDAGRKYIDSFD
ncbi:PTS sugar transporter subunit IIA [Pseudogemmobacter sp. W21_MBD1_M6]|uniref:PTS sugar transporter subunit IIA n=1 Tax=Pseudogemmobacter sp. W21_MBD1_M6 TaxID=3240271 RepID=UPI003F981B73